MADDIDTILAKYGENPRDYKVVWSVQGTRVISHKALERIASKAGIKYEMPNILRCERDEAVILVAGTLGDAREWSIGEALTVAMQDTGKKNQWNKPIYAAPEGAVGNYQVTPKQAAYPYAMAEKRAKDRVILKLLNLHGQAYSEEEADEFKPEAEPKTNVKEFKPAVTSNAIALGREIKQCKSLLDLNTLKKQPEFIAFWKAAHDEDRNHITAVAEKHKADLETPILQAGE